MSTQDDKNQNTRDNTSEEEKNEKNLENSTHSDTDDNDWDDHDSQSDTPPPPQSDEEKIKSLTAELDSVNTKLAETHDRMLRIAADAENTRKRLEKEKRDTRLYSIQEFALDLLPVIDSFNKALQTIENMDSNENNEISQLTSIIDGVKLVSKIFNDAIKKHGIEKVPGKDSPFNPTYHNAIAKEVSDKYNTEVVIEEFMSGYKINDRILRTALVKVGAPD